MFILAKGLVSWRSTLQSMIAFSTTNTKYIAVMEVFKEAIWLYGLTEDLRIVQEHMDLHCDSQNVFFSCKEPSSSFPHQAHQCLISFCSRNYRKKEYFATKDWHCK